MRKTPPTPSPLAALWGNYLLPFLQIGFATTFNALATTMVILVIKPDLPPLPVLKVAFLTITFFTTLSFLLYLAATHLP